MKQASAGDTAKPDARFIGVVGADVPRQLVLAAQATPVRMFGSWEGEITAEAGQLLGAADAVTLRILDQLLKGHLGDPLALVVCNDSMANLRLFYVTRLLSQRGHLPFPVHLVDAPRGAGSPRLRFVTGQFARLAHFLGSVTGRAPDRESLLRAAAQEHEVGRALARLRGRRLAGQCSGSDALRAYRAAAQTAPEEAVRIIDAASTAGVEDAQRIYVTGSSHPDESLYSILESTGKVIAGEDHDAGDSTWIGEAAHVPEPDSVCRELAALHAARPPLAARALTGERVKHLERQIRSTRSVGALALIRELDDAPAWDLPRQKSALRAGDIPMVSRVRIPASGARRAAYSILDEMTQPRWKEQP